MELVFRFSAVEMFTTVVSHCAVCCAEIANCRFCANSIMNVCCGVVLGDRAISILKITNSNLDLIRS